MDDVLNWLLVGDPWVEYGARVHLLHQDTQEPRVIQSRKAMLDHPLVQNLVRELSDWPGYAISSHKSAGQLFHKLTFAADIGLDRFDPGMNAIITRILEHQDPLGPFQLRSNTPVHFGGSGEDTWGWALCDAPLELYALVKFGLVDHPAVRKGIDYLVGLLRENGWPCTVSKELGKFRGPGRKDDPCPFATLIMLKLVAQLPDLRDSESARMGAEALISAWQHRVEQHAYMFYMGTDFCKLKVPFIWYDILHVCDVLTRFDWLKTDPRLHEMLSIIQSKADNKGRYTLESIWTAWKDWEFGQKKEPSRWLTLQVFQILQRVN